LVLVVRLVQMVLTVVLVLVLRLEIFGLCRAVQVHPSVAHLLNPLLVLVVQWVAEQKTRLLIA
jgi:hypothetical protein